MNRQALVFCVLAVISCTLCSCKGKATWTGKVGGHAVSVSTDASLWGGHSHGTIQGSNFTYEYSSGFRATLQNEVLTVDGKRYIIPDKSDSITVENGYVEINGQPASPAE